MSRMHTSPCRPSGAVGGWADDVVAGGASAQWARSALVEVVEKRLRRDRPEGVFDDAGDLGPIDVVVAIVV